jgi:signal transduction histidine kinase
MKSIRRQLACELMSAHAILLGAGLVTLTLFIWQELVASFDSAILTRALALSALTEVENGRIQFDFSDDFLRGFGVEHPRSYFEIWDAAGSVLARSPSLNGTDLPPGGAGTPERPELRNLTLANGRSARALSFVFVPTAAAAGPAGSPDPRARLVVAVDRGALNETIEGVVAAVAGCGGLLLLVGYLVLQRVLRRGLATVDHLGERAAEIDASSLASRFSAAELPAELRPIAERFNDLLSRLQASFERERRFNADLAHELRTPIAELRSLAECSLKWPDARDAAVDDDVLSIAVQMETLVTHMFTLALGEEGRLAVNFGPVEILSLVTQAWQPLEGRARERMLNAHFTVGADTVTADAVMLLSIVSNLLDNAVTYAPAGGAIQISGKPSPDGYLLQIANEAPGLQTADLSRLFDRFWRKDPARSGGEHFGLGLSLAATFAKAMDWKLSARLDDEGWLTIALASVSSASSPRPKIPLRRV